MLKNLCANPDIKQLLTKLAAGGGLEKTSLQKIRSNIVMYKDGVRVPFRYPEGLRECYGSICHIHRKGSNEENVIKISTNDASSQ